MQQAGGSDRESEEHLAQGGFGQQQEVVRPVYIFAACAALNSCNLGFDIGVNTDVGPTLLRSSLINCSEQKLEVFMGSLNLFAIGGALLASLIADAIGRRRSFAVAAAGFIVGVIIMASAGSFAALMTGRVLVGLGVGFGFAVDPVYISEISPPHARGRLVTWSEIGTNIGILVGFGAGALLSKLPDAVAWRYMLGTGVVLPLVMLCLVRFVMPESPRWLIRKGRLEEAHALLAQLYPPGEDIEAVIFSIEENIRQETADSGVVSWQMLLLKPAPALRRMLLVGIGVAVCQQLVGIDAIQYFLLFILKESGITKTSEQFKYLIMLGLLKLACIFIAGPLFDSKGRRPLMLGSCTGMALALLILAMHMSSVPTTLKEDQGNPCEDHAATPGSGTGGDAVGGDSGGAWLPVGALALYLISFSLGMGPGAWLIPSEIFSNTVRAKAMSLATVSNRLAATFMASSFLTAAKFLTYSGVLLCLALMTAGVGGFLFVYLPETKGKSLEEMLGYFTEVAGDTDNLLLQGNSSSSGGSGGDGGGGLVAPMRDLNPTASYEDSASAKPKASASDGDP